MMFRRLSEKLFRPLFMWVIILGIISLCQPWFFSLHVYGLMITIIGVAGFIVFIHVKPHEGI